MSIKGQASRQKLKPPDSYTRTVARISDMQPGETLVYSTDEWTRDEGVWAAAREAYEAGLVTLLARRNRGRLERIAVRK